jgi:hypothetical protein
MYTIHARVGNRIPTKWESLKIAASRTGGEFLTYAGAAVALHVGALLAAGGAVPVGTNIGAIAAGGGAGKAFIAWAGTVAGAKGALIAQKAVEKGSVAAVKGAIKNIVLLLIQNEPTKLDHYVRRWSTWLHPYVKIEGGVDKPISIKKSSFDEMSKFTISNIIAPDPHNPRYWG